jgi:predicted O-methyltransferase YrrM
MHPYILSSLKKGLAVQPDGSNRLLTSNIDHEEADFLASIISQVNPISLGVEIGLACGISAGVICSEASKTNPEYQHIAIDPFQSMDYNCTGIETVKKCGHNQIQLIEERSDKSLPSLLEHYEGKVDVVFIDGLHTFDATLFDIMMALRLLRVGGVIIIDDCRMPPIAKAVAYFQNYECIKTLRGSSNNSFKLSRLASLAAGRVPKQIASVLPTCIYNYLYPRSWMSTMMVLQKIKPDTRHWNWYRTF